MSYRTLRCYCLVFLFEENMSKNRKSTRMRFLECLEVHWIKFVKKPLPSDRCACNITACCPLGVVGFTGYTASG